ncbi:MAG: gluconate 2-dehydrogenase subunit 3 family protein [Terriglobia bacterium]
MAGQSVERREVLRILALAAAASNFPGFHRWAFACGHGDLKASSAPAAHYTPQFFTAHEYAMVERLTDLIIPAGGGPGATEAGVSEFIDFMAWSDASIQYRFRYGLTWLDTRSDAIHRKAFLDLNEGGQKDILDHLAYKRKFRPGEEEGRDFFALIREYTLMGFYTSRVGLQELDYPGLKVFYTETPRCPHHGDPGHLHLPAPKL